MTIRSGPRVNVDFNRPSIDLNDILKFILPTQESGDKALMMIIT